MPAASFGSIFHTGDNGKRYRLPGKQRRFLCIYAIHVSYSISGGGILKSVKTFIKCIAIPLLVGGLSAVLTRGAMQTFQSLNQPPLSPPAWLFPVVWTILYVLMGIASYLVYTSDAESSDITKALTKYGYQLAVNFLWPIFFFTFKWYGFSFLWLVLLWILIWETMTLFFSISKPAGYLMIPYLVWVTFAGYLNLGIWYFN